MKNIVNKIVVFVLIFGIGNLVWFGWLSPWVMTYPDNIAAPAGAAMYLVGFLADFYGIWAYWKKEIQQAWKKLKEGFTE